MSIVKFKSKVASALQNTNYDVLPDGRCVVHINYREDVGGSVYTNTTRVFSLLGGCWDRTVIGIVFPLGVDPKEYIHYDDDQRGGFVIPPEAEKQLMVEMKTPPEIAKTMLNDVKFGSKAKVLEPSGGNGALCDMIVNLMGVSPSQIDVVELNHKHHPILKRKGYQIVGDDFLRINTHNPEEGYYDYVVMHPPTAWNLDARHLLRAFVYFLKPGGSLWCVMGDGAAFYDTDLSCARFRGVLRRWGNEMLLSQEMAQTIGLTSARIVKMKKPYFFETNKFNKMVMVHPWDSTKAILTAQQTLANLRQCPESDQPIFSQVVVPALKKGEQCQLDFFGDHQVVFTK